MPAVKKGVRCPRKLATKRNIDSERSVVCSLHAVGYAFYFGGDQLLTIYKSGDLSDVNNYRPIALVSVVSTFFENIA